MRSLYLFAKLLYTGFSQFSLISYDIKLLKLEDFQFFECLELTQALLEKKLLIFGISLPNTIFAKRGIGIFEVRGFGLVFFIA
jgi:hypothetical protein